MTQQYTMELADYFTILRKRKLPFITTFLVILISGLVIAFTLPPVYRSEATILIERQEIPQDLVATTVTGYVQERIEGIRQRLVTFDNLVDISKKLDLHPELREKGDISTLVATIRENIIVEMVDIKAGGSKAMATIAFVVGYEASSAKTAQKVAAELAKRYLEANKQARSEQAAEVSQFLGEEAEKLRFEIVELEKTLAEFKQKQASQLPELLDVNVRLYEKTEGQIESTRDRILKIEDQIVALQSELSLTDPRKPVRTEDGKIIQSPSERLNLMTSTYLQYSARYSPTHPDMVRLRREIQALSSQSSEASKIGKLVEQLTLLNARLRDAKQKYANEHPDVKRLENSVAAVENELRVVNVSEPKEFAIIDLPADNPRYVTLKTQLVSARSNLREEKSKLLKYKEKLAEYEARLFQTPIVERDYQELTRDYGNAKKKYAELRDKQMEARLAEQLEAGEKGERFVLEGGAYLPTSPDKPNRLGIALLAGLLAAMGGIAAIALAEFKDKSIHGSRGVVEAYGALPIAIIPYIEITSDVTRHKMRQFMWIGVLLGLILMVLMGVHLYWMSFDQIWLKLVNN